MRGAGFRILTGTVTSPTLASQIEAMLNTFPQARWIQYEPLGGGVADVLGRAFGQRVEPRLKIENADVILSLDGDFMDCGPGEIRNARAFADRRRLEGGVTTMNRLYMVESRTSNTGTKADHRLAGPRGRHRRRGPRRRRQAGRRRRDGRRTAAER